MNPFNKDVKIGHFYGGSTSKNEKENYLLTNIFA